METLKKKIAAGKFWRISRKSFLYKSSHKNYWLTITNCSSHCKCVVLSYLSLLYLCYKVIYNVLTVTVSIKTAFEQINVVGACSIVRRLELRMGLGWVRVSVELDMGPFCRIQSNSIQQLNDPIHSNPR